MLSLPEYALLVNGLLALVVSPVGCGGAANAFGNRGDDGNGENIGDRGGEDDDDDSERLVEERSDDGEIEKGDANGGREEVGEGGS